MSVRLFTAIIEMLLLLLGRHGDMLMLIGL